LPREATPSTPQRCKHATLSKRRAVELLPDAHYKTKTLNYGPRAP
jgi:hypothetical protein